MDGEGGDVLRKRTERVKSLKVRHRGEGEKKKDPSLIRRSKLPGEGQRKEPQ